MIDTRRGTTYLPPSEEELKKAYQESPLFRATIDLSARLILDVIDQLPDKKGEECE